MLQGLFPNRWGLLDIRQVAVRIERLAPNRTLANPVGKICRPASIPIRTIRPHGTL